ncbi:MAG: pyridoxal phosphate-dependent aminotransferase [Enterocloster asparagiformis]|nr:pyridoxal phosphate-dependent aminotransferase [Enterocloster asparagiformis]
MDLLTEKFAKLGVDSAPGQEKLQKETMLELRGERLQGTPVDFSHGDVDAFRPLPGSKEAFDAGYAAGGKQAYTEYRGSAEIRRDVADKLSRFTGAGIDPARNLILTPGTQGALFLAMGAMAARGDKVAIVEPDYFANRKLAEFFECIIVPVQMRYFEAENEAGLDLRALEEAFRGGVKLFLFSNPNNPTGAVYSDREIRRIAALARAYGVSLIVDELYSRQIFDGRGYTHLCALEEGPEEMVTIIGPSKTESLSGYRLGAAFGSEKVIARMEKLQAIVSLRAAGYCQSAFKVWFEEPEGFMEKRVREHQEIRDALVEKFQAVPGVRVRPADGGSYLFVQLPPLDVSIGDFVKIVRRLADVTVTPGTEFGPGFTDSFRINFSQDKKAALAAMDRLLAVMERYRRA